MISTFFITRPIFAWVVAIMIMLAGVIGIEVLPIAQYPSIAPPAVQITATYPGASADTLQTSVTEVIEQQLIGLDHLMYFSSNGTSSGAVTITATFEAGTNPDIAQVQVQNKVQQATPLLPTEVQVQGLGVQKSQASFLLVVVLFDRTDHQTTGDVGDIITDKLLDPISHVNGVGQTQVFGGQYAMRIWLDPYKLNSFKLTPADVRTAVTAQNIEVSGGQIGALPAIHGQELNANVNVRSRLQTPEQFRNIVLFTSQTGARVLLRDVARVELGADSYDFTARLNRHPAAGLGIQLTPGADALKTIEAVKAVVTKLQPGLPAGVDVNYAVDNSTFVRLSIKDVIVTLIEAIGLVVVVMFLFLQNWRAILIPAIAVPVVLLGTFGVLAAAGMSINTLTLFALVLAIGLLVDDAIVVVENVERILEEDAQITPHDATIKSMGEITPALVGITTVLIAVFLPLAFFSGSTGVIYRQFSISMISAMSLSLFVALVLTPALCSTLLKRRKPAGKDGKPAKGFFAAFNRVFDAGRERYGSGLGVLIGHRWATMIAYLAVSAVMVALYLHMPTGFLPEEDQGSVLAQFTLPPGAAASRTAAIGQQIEDHFLDGEKADVDVIFTVTGFSFSGAGQNTGIAFIKLTDWAKRKGAANRAPAIVERAMGAFHGIRDAQVFAFVPPAVQELGNANGFDFELTDVGGVGHEKLIAARNQLLALAAADKSLLAVRPNGEEDSAQLDVDIDQARAGAMGLQQADINDTLSTIYGVSYIDQFTDRGRVKRVYMQGDAPYRMSPAALDAWHVRTASGTMAAVSAFTDAHWTYGANRLERYNGAPSVEMLGQGSGAVSSGAAMAAMEALTAKLPPGIGHDWTGLSYQERLAGSQAYLLYVLALVVVFLCLAALYESWSVPVAVLMVVPIGVVGALIASTLRGLDNNIYFQVGLLTTIGLAAKNAILIIQYAIAEEAGGAKPIDAAITAAKLRMRPILMTSLAFVTGCIPLMIATGAGSGSQQAIGTAVVGGMLAATILAIFFVPVFFVIIQALFHGGEKKPGAEPAGAPAPAAAG